MAFATLAYTIDDQVLNISPGPPTAAAEEP
jgi:hypothetical protein